MVYNFLRKNLVTLAAMGALALYGADSKAEDELIEPTTIEQEDEDITVRNNPSRNFIGTSLNYYTLLDEGAEYERGMSLHIDGDFTFELNNRIHINSRTDLTYVHLDALDYKISKDITDLGTLLSLRFPFRQDRPARGFIDVGLEYRMQNSQMEYYNRISEISIHTIGPTLGIGMHSEYFDLQLDGAVLFGHGDREYLEDSIHLERLRLTLTPRIDWFSMPIELEGIGWSIFTSPGNTYNVSLELNIRPTFEIQQNISLFINFSYNTTLNGDNSYDEFEAGGGVNFQWGG